MTCMLFDYSPKPERAEETATHTSRRDFLRRAGGAAGLGLVHFTILGTLATPAFAETDDDCGAECPSDPNILDICTCKSGDNTTPPRDVCNCGAADPGAGTQDVCECGNESASDYCTCGGDQAATSDVCSCAPETANCDTCACGYVDAGAQGHADQCECGDEQGTGSAHTDYCICDADRGLADCCACSQSDRSDPPGSSSSADYCNCTSGDTSANADYCVNCPSEGDEHDDPTNAESDACQCGNETDSDTCFCYHDGSVEYPGDGSGADYCKCDVDSQAEVDCCACCGDLGGADTCNCSSETPSTNWCGGEYPTVEDWCAEGWGPEDTCTCKSGDAGGTQGADYCSINGNNQGCEPESGINDVCECGAEGASDTCSASCKDANVEDYCAPGQGEPADYCNPDFQGSDV